jgi:molybdopterin converting factor small subunit
LRTGIADLAPEVATLLSNSLFSVDLEYANENDLLREDQEVAMIPPVSGG